MSKKTKAAERASKEAFWRPHIESWQKSGLPSSTYCRETGLTPHLFKYWQYELAPETKHQSPVKVSKQKPSTVSTPFIQVEPPNTELAVSSSTMSGIILQVDSHYVIKLSPSFDSQTLHQLLTCLRGL